MNNNRGFTLLEILVSIVILGIVLTVFFQFFILSQRATTGNVDKLVAVNIAEGVLEKIKNGEYEEINAPGIYDISNCNDYSGTVKTACNARYLKEVNDFKYKIEVTVKKELIEDETKYDNPKTGLYPVEVNVKDDDVISNVKGLVEL